MRVQETIRDDGLRIISCRIPTAKKVDVSLIAQVGSAYDPPGKEGLFHYFEHVAFQGTDKRSSSEIRIMQARLLDAGAATGRMRTWFYGEAMPKKLSLACDLLCDLYCHPLMSREGVAHEMGIILTEIAQAEDDDNRVSYRVLWELLWPRHVMRHWGAGTKESIKNITLEDIVSAHSKWYVPSNTIAIAAGRVAHEEFVEIMSCHAAFSKNGTVNHPQWNDEYENPPAAKSVTIPRLHREKATIVFGCKFPFLSEEYEEVLRNFLMALLVQGPESRLFNELREKKSLVYSVGGGVDVNYPLGSYFYVYVHVLPEQIPLICEMVPDLLSLALSDQQSFLAVKERFEDDFTLGYENLRWCASHVLQAISHGRSPRRAERRYQRMKSHTARISLEEVEALRRKTILPERMVTVVLDPRS